MSPQSAFQCADMNCMNPLNLNLLCATVLLHNSNKAALARKFKIVGDNYKCLHR